MTTDEMTTATAARPVPFVDLDREHREILDQLHAALDDVVADGGFVLGRELDLFEREFAEYCGVSHCVGVASGTAALGLAVRAAGIGAGDEVIVPAHTFIASALGVLHAGAAPVLCDVEADTGLIDADAAAAAIGPRTAAIVAVHLYGQPCDMTAICELARRHGILVIEDAAHAHGARFAGRRAGSLGDVAAFSFYPSKNLGALGDGGAVCTSDPELADRVRRLRNLGQRRKGEHLDVGSNERLDGLQAAFLRLKLPRLDAKNDDRRGIRRLYEELLPEEVRLTAINPRCEPVHHLMAVRVRNRDEVLRRLRDWEVCAGVHYWPALQRQPPLAGATTMGALEVATEWSETELSLPMFPGLTSAEVAAVAQAVDAAVTEDW
jgi:dTDP-4-amino-4,6-dideoxygalactose transaminase